MFGKPSWFKEKTFGWGLYPICRQGWIYTAVWAGVLCVPFLLLLSFRGVPESLIWMAVAIGVLIWDVRKILQQMRRKDEQDVFFIGEDNNAASHVATRNYDLHVRE